MKIIKPFLLLISFVLITTLLIAKHKDPNQSMQGVDKKFFIENKGQWHQDVLYLCRMGGLDAWITKTGINYTFYENDWQSSIKSIDLPPRNFHHEELQNATLIGHRVIMKFEGINTTLTAEGKQKQEGYYNYLLGNDPSKHATFVGLYKEVLVKDIYKGIDIRYYYDKGFLRYDFIVSPGADPSQIAFTLNGQNAEYLKGNDLYFITRFGEVALSDLYTYQEDKFITSKFVKRDHHWQFCVGQYNTNNLLVIDPLVFSTFLGGNANERATGIALDGNANVYLTGNTSSPNYDITAGAFQIVKGLLQDAFVSKLNANGTALVYSTFLGGGGSDSGTGIAVDGNGIAYITGNTNSNNFVVTQGSFQTVYGGGNLDAFVLKVNSNGSSLDYSTYLGGSDYDDAWGIAIDDIGNAYLTGGSWSNDFNVTVGSFQTSLNGTNDVFVSKLNSTGSGLDYSTFLGGSFGEVAYGIAVDDLNCAYIIGGTYSLDYPVTSGAIQTIFGGGNGDGFVTKLNVNGTALVYSSYLGGSDNDNGNDIVVDDVGCAYLIGTTTSTDYVTTPGSFQTNLGGLSDVFVTKIDSIGSTRIYSTFIGGGGHDYGNGIEVESSGSAYITGVTTSSDFDTTSSSFQTNLGGYEDGFVCKLNDIGSALAYSTYLGKSLEEAATDIAVDGNGNAVIVGSSSSADFYITPGVYKPYHSGFSDVFVAKLCLSASEASFSQSICINDTFPGIVFTTIGVSGIATTSGLPNGLTASWTSNVVTISGTPNIAGIYNYNISLIGGCDILGTIIVNDLNTVSSAPSASVCLNNQMPLIQLSTTGANGIGTPSGLPPGISASWASGVIILSGTPIVAGTYNYIIPLSGGCGIVNATGTIVVNPLNTVVNQPTVTECVNSSITPIVIPITGATGIGLIFGLPSGVVASWSPNAITLSGIPTVTGTYNYNIQLTGGCGYVSASGTIVVNSNNTVVINPTYTTVCINETISPILGSTTGASGIGIPTGLPPGVQAVWSQDTLTISGTPSVSGFYNYSIPLTGGCGNVNATGFINVIPDNTVSSNPPAIVCLNKTMSPITHISLDASGIGIPTGLPPGLTAVWGGLSSIVISGTPNSLGTYNYSIPLTGGCGSVSATGTITVEACTGVEDHEVINFKLYPNPNSGRFVIQSEYGGVFELTDIAGRTINTYMIPTSPYTITENLSAGLYFIREQNSGSIVKLQIE